MSITKLVLALSIAASAPLSAHAFEGVLHVKATLGPMGSIDSKIHVRESGDQRVDTTMPMMGNVAISMIRKKGSANAVQLMHAQKEFIEFPAPPDVASEDPSMGEFEVKVIGKELVSGYNAQHVQLIPKKGGSVVDVWVTKDLAIGDAGQMMGQGGGMGGLLSALQSKGVAGYPMKIATKQGGQEMVIETTKVEKRKLAADLFEVPKGYKKSTTPAFPGMPGMSGPPPGAPPPR